MSSGLRMPVREVVSTCTKEQCKPAEFPQFLKAYFDFRKCQNCGPVFQKELSQMAFLDQGLYAVAVPGYQLDGFSHRRLLLVHS